MARSEKLTLERARRNISYGVVLGISTLLAACGASKPKPSSTAENSDSGSTNIARNIPASDFAWDKRQTLTYSTYGKWDPSHPEPLRATHLNGSNKYLLVVDDGRFNYPANPDPNTDHPTGLYSAATQTGQSVTEVPDGTVLKVIGWANNGEPISDAHGGSGYPTWEEVVGHDGTKAWVPWVNVGYTALRELHELPQTPSGM